MTDVIFAILIGTFVLVAFGAVLLLWCAIAINRMHDDDDWQPPAEHPYFREDDDE